METNNISNILLPENSKRRISLNPVVAQPIATPEMVAAVEGTLLTALSILPYNGLTYVNVEGTSGRLSVEADEVTLEVTSPTGDDSTPPILGDGVVKIKAGGVGTTQLAVGAVTTVNIADDAVERTHLHSNVAGDGLRQSVGGALDVSVDGSTIEITADELNVMAGGITSTELAAGSVTNVKVATGIDAVKIADGTVTNTEFQHINSVTSNVQTQLDTKVSNTDFTFEVPFTSGRVLRDPNTGTFAFTDMGISDATDHDGITPVLNMNDAQTIKLYFGFIVPSELDTSIACSIKYYYRISGLGADGSTAYMELNIRNVPINGNTSSGGEVINTSQFTLDTDNSLADGTLQTTTKTAVLTTTFLGGGVFIKGSITRLGSHASDSYTGIIQMIAIQIIGKRKVS